MATDSDGKTSQLKPDFCELNKSKLTFDDVLETQCGSLMFRSIHELSQLLFNYKFTDTFPTLDEILEHVSKTKTEGTITEETFFDLEDVPTDPVYKKELLRQHSAVLMTRTGDPHLVLFYHYHFFHLFCNYKKTTNKIIKAFRPAMSDMRKICWYFLCIHTSSQTTVAYRDSNYKSQLSRYAQFHNWYMDREVDEYNLQLGKFADNKVLGTTTAIDPSSPYWSTLLSVIIDLQTLVYDQNNPIDLASGDEGGDIDDIGGNIDPNLDPPGPLSYDQTLLIDSTQLDSDDNYTEKLVPKEGSELTHGLYCRTVLSQSNSQVKTISKQIQRAMAEVSTLAAELKLALQFHERNLYFCRYNSSQPYLYSKALEHQEKVSSKFATTRNILVQVIDDELAKPLSDDPQNGTENNHEEDEGDHTGNTGSTPKSSMTHQISKSADSVPLQEAKETGRDGRSKSRSAVKNGTSHKRKRNVSRTPTGGSSERSGKKPAKKRSQAGSKPTQKTHDQEEDDDDDTPLSQFHCLDKTTPVPLQKPVVASPVVASLVGVPLEPPSPLSPLGKLTTPDVLKSLDSDPNNTGDDNDLGSKSSSDDYANTVETGDFPDEGSDIPAHLIEVSVTTNEVSQCLAGAQKVSQAPTEVSEAAQKVSEDAQKVSQPSTEVSEGTQKVSEDAQKVSEDAQKVSQPSTEVSEGNKEVSFDEQEVSEVSDEVSIGGNDVTNETIRVALLADGYSPDKVEEGVERINNTCKEFVKLCNSEADFETVDSFYRKYYFLSRKADCLRNYQDRKERKLWSNLENH